jgi:hypothetical protein
VRAGFSFNGKRDLYSVYGYPHTLSSADLLAKYERQDIAQRVVDKPAEGIWVQPPTPTGKGVAQGFKDKFSEVANHADLWTIMYQADRLCAFAPYSVIFLGLPGRPDSEAPQVRNVEELAYVQAYGADKVVIDSPEMDTSSPRYGLPLFYRLATTTPHPSLRVHHSRIIHMVDRPLMGKTEAIPRLQVLYNLLEDVLKVAGGSAETFWLTANRGMQADIDPELQLSATDADELDNEIEEYQHNLRRFIRTRGVEIKNLGSDVADPSGVFKVLISLLAGATGIPQRILIGAEAGQLASEQDRANWADYVENRRKVFAEPYVLRPLVRKFQEIALLPENPRAQLEWEWPDAFKQNPLERSQTSAQYARALINMSRRNEKDNPIASDEECRVMMGLPEKPPPGHTMPEVYEPPIAAAPAAAPGQPGRRPARTGPDTRTSRPNRPGQRGDGPSGQEAGSGGVEMEWDFDDQRPERE